MQNYSLDVISRDRQQATYDREGTERCTLEYFGSARESRI